MTARPRTDPQMGYVESLRVKLRLPKTLLDNHCEARFGQPLERLNRAQVSGLINEMKGWVTIPAEMQRQMGQQDLPGMGG